MSVGDPWSPGLVARGSLQWNGRTTEPTALAASVDRLADRLAVGRAAGVAGGRAARDTDRWVDTTDLGVPDLLTAVFAAAAARVPVFIGGPSNASRTDTWRGAVSDSGVSGVPNPGPIVHLADEPLPVGAFLIVSTSGSTAAPRAIVRTLASWTRSFDGYTELTGLTTGDHLLLTGPPTSTLQLFAAVHTLAIGATVTDEPDRATAAVCVPTVLPNLIGLPRLRSVVVAGARLADQTASLAISSGLRIAEYYGAAELSFVAARRFPTDTAVDPDPLRAFPGVQIALRDGVLWSRSPFHADGYLGTPGGMRTDAAGFATVGDLARWDDAGLTVLGRGDTAVTVGGRTVLVEDVEAVLAGIEGLADAAVAGVPHDRLGQQLVALAVLEPGNELAAVRSAARRLLTGESLPQRWILADQIPRTAGGKVDRGAIARWMHQSGPTEPRA